METIMTILNSGAKEWRNENGELHRENGPAIIYADGQKEWYLNGELHREDGPAVIYSDGQKEYWLNGEDYTEKQYKEKVRKRKLSVSFYRVEIITLTITNHGI